MPNWNDVLNDIVKRQQDHSLRTQLALDDVRREHLSNLQKHTGRNVIAYYSGFLSKPNINQTEINDEDKNGFMMAVHRLDRKLGLDLIIHTPGGDIAAAESLVNYLHQMFGTDIRAIVPQIAMSAGTMLACSCKTIVMGAHSNLGPIDPWVRGVPALVVVSEFKKAFREIKKDADKVAVWAPIITQYRPTFLSQCEHAIIWSRNFVAQQLKDTMFAGEPDAPLKAKKIVNRLSNYNQNRTHSRHIHIDECIAMGLKVGRIEMNNDFQDLLLTVHHCYMHTMMNSPAFKIIENHLGTAFVKRIQQQ
jgi:hypothetical protein